MGLGNGAARVAGVAMTAVLLIGACAPQPLERVRAALPSHAAADVLAGLRLPAPGAGEATPSAPPPIDVRAYLGYPVRRGPARGMEIALTLDDGPSGDTSRVLGIFERAHARATFFYVGKRVLLWPDQARRAIRIGCEIEDHTYNHVELTGLPADRVRWEVATAAQVIEQVTGETPVWVRPRGGRADASARAVIRSLGMAEALWDASASDTTPSPPARAIVARVLAEARPGSIVVLHETNRETVAALPFIIRGLRERGFRLVTLREMFGPPRAG